MQEDGYREEAIKPSFDSAKDGVTPSKVEVLFNTHTIVRQSLPAGLLGGSVRQEVKE
jgi:hypothetical protein